jgi:hypothetical protein
MDRRRDHAVTLVASDLIEARDLGGALTHLRHPLCCACAASGQPTGTAAPPTTAMNSRCIPDPFALVRRKRIGIERA